MSSGPFDQVRENLGQWDMLFGQGSVGNTLHTEPGHARGSIFSRLRDHFQIMQPKNVDRILESV